MEPKGSITRAIEQARQQHPDAAEVIFHRYFGRLLRAAAAQLDRRQPGLLDPEAAAVSALRSALAHLDRDGLARVTDSQSLLKHLFFTLREKVIQQQRAADAAKRGRTLVVCEGALDRDGNGGGLDATFISHEPSPEHTAWLAELMARLAARLTASQMKVIELDLEGYSEEEIAEALNISPRSVYNYRVKALKAAREIEDRGKP